jgi:hypothetical protein
MILRTRGPLRIAEVWLDEPYDGLKADFASFHCRSAPIDGQRCKEKLAIVLDLSKPEETLLAAMTRTTRHQIHRTARAGLRVSRLEQPDGAAISRFCEFYGEFARQKGLNAKVGDGLRSFASAGRLILSEIPDESGRTLVWHSYIHCCGRARLLQTASLFRECCDSASRNLVGRCNRYLHWEDIVYFKARGFRVYDFGGWYGGGKDEERLRINGFKEEFGGEIVRNFDLEMALTPLGRTALLLRRLRGRLQRRPD